ncbi:acetyl-CoA synthetase-like protein [Colletotrichum sublineola]|nr:acetyl-CoA synthetase-like protein [Colletotrichum sublineola]
MSSGYINRPDETSKVFAPHPFPGDAGHAYIYRTSDIGMLVGEQGFVVLGRVDFQFKIDGNRVQPEEVESIINHVPHVVRSSVILVAPSIGRPVTTFWTDFISTAEKACSDHLPAYMKPYRWLRFDEFPETPIGKTDTATLTRAAKFIIDNGSSVMTNGYQQKNPKLILGNGKIFLDLAIGILTGSNINAVP